MIGTSRALLHTTHPSLQTQPREETQALRCAPQSQKCGCSRGAALQFVGPERLDPGGPGQAVHRNVDEGAVHEEPVRHQPLCAAPHAAARLQARGRPASPALAAAEEGGLGRPTIELARPFPRAIRERGNCSADALSGGSVATLSKQKREFAGVCGRSMKGIKPDTTTA